MENRDKRNLLFPLMYALAVLSMIIAQVIRREQTNVLTWVICDCTGRLVSLTVLALLPISRQVAYRNQPLSISWLWATVGIIAFILCSQLLEWVLPFGDKWIPYWHISYIPRFRGWVEITQMTFGIALVAYQEEVLFRRCTRALLCSSLGNGVAMVVVSAAMFGLYHWSGGVSSMVYAFCFGVFAMYFFKWTESLWPVIVAHYLIDLGWFL